MGTLSGLTGAHGSSKLVPARAFIKLQVRLYARLTPASTYLTIDFQGVKPSESGIQANVPCVWGSVTCAYVLLLL